jgi:hypothetical protein
MRSNIPKTRVFKEYSERILAGEDWGQGFWYSGLVQKDNEESQV